MHNTAIQNLSSDDDNYDALVEAGILNQLATKYLLINELVLVTDAENEDINSYNDIFNNEDTSLAIIDPEDSLAGTYAKELLNQEQEDKNLDAERVTTVADLDSAVESIKTGDSDAGFLLRTDVSDNDDIRIIQRAPRSILNPLVYGLGLSQSVEDGSAARVFYDFLQSEEALEIYTNYGYIV